MVFVGWQMQLNPRTTFVMIFGGSLLNSFGVLVELK